MKDMRNKAVHQGTLPNQSEIKQVTEEIEKFLFDLVYEVFTVYFDELIIIDFVKTDIIRQALKSSHQFMQKQNWHLATKSAGLAFFMIREAFLAILNQDHAEFTYDTLIQYEKYNMGIDWFFEGWDFEFVVPSIRDISRMLLERFSVKEEPLRDFLRYSLDYHELHLENFRLLQMSQILHFLGINHSDIKTINDIMIRIDKLVWGDITIEVPKSEWNKIDKIMEELLFKEKAARKMFDIASKVIVELEGQVGSHLDISSGREHIRTRDGAMRILEFTEEWFQKQLSTEFMVYEAIETNDPSGQADYDTPSSDEEIPF